MTARKKKKKKIAITHIFDDLKEDTVRGIWGIVFLFITLFFILSALNLAGIVGQTTYKGLSLLFNNSVSQTRTIIHNLKKDGCLISTRVTRMFAKNIPYEMFRTYDFKRNYYWHNGSIFKIEPNIYTL